MLDAESVWARVHPGWIGSCDCEACNRSCRSIAREFLRVQAETLEECACQCETPETVGQARWFHERADRSRAELKKLAGERA
jgi:hypothetical protein